MLRGYATDSNASSARSVSYSPRRRARPESRFVTGASVKKKEFFKDKEKKRWKSFQSAKICSILKTSREKGCKTLLRFSVRKF